VTRTLKITGLVFAIGLVPLPIVGALVKQREGDRAKVDSALVSRANVQRWNWTRASPAVARSRC
jgi:hypothetical protein